MKFVMFDHPTHEGATTIAINPAHVHAVVAAIGPKGRDSRVSALLMSHASDEGIGVVGSVAEVVAALESATAPPVAAAVEVAPTDLGQVAALLDLFAEDGIVWSRVDYVLGLDDTAGWGETRSALKALAAKLRGGG